jgi:hypothetical protein
LHWARDDEAMLAWDAIIAIDVDASAIVFRLEGDETKTWVVTAGAAELALRLKELKQKAAHGLL